MLQIGNAVLNPSEELSKALHKYAPQYVSLKSQLSITESLKHTIQKFKKFFLFFL